MIVSLRIAIISRTKVKECFDRGILIVKGIAKLDYSLFFKLCGDSKVRGHTYKIVKNTFCLDVMISNRVVDAWNELPQYVVDAETVNSFKARLDKFYRTIKLNKSYAKNI